MSTTKPVTISDLVLMDIFDPEEVEGFSSTTTPTTLNREEEPVLYYQQLRQSAAEGDGARLLRSSPQHQVVELELPKSPGERIRIMHIAQMLPVNPESSYSMYIDAPGFFALKHFNERSNLVVPNLGELLDGCNIYLTMDILDSEYSPIAASSKLYNYFSKKAFTPTVQSPQPAAFVGAYSSAVSKPLSILAGTYGVPLVSPASTAHGLDDAGSAPTFGRTIPTNAGMAEAGVVYLKSLGITSFAVLSVRNQYGISFRKDLWSSAAKHGLDMVSVAYEPHDLDSMARACMELKQSGRRSVFGIMDVQDYQDVLEQAYSSGGGFSGENYLWIFPELDFLAEHGFSVDRLTRPGLAEGIQGALVLNLHNKPNPNFAESVAQLQTNSKLQSDFLSLHLEDSSYEGVNLSQIAPNLSSFSYTAYDAVMSLGIAACRAENDMFTGQELFDSFKNTSFTGASGHVMVDRTTGTRNYETVSFSLRNILADKTRSNDLTAVYTSQLSVVVDFDAEEVVQTINAPIFCDGSTTPPLSLPKVEVETNNIPVGILCIGWVLSGLLLLACIYLGWWVHKYRNKHIIRASQPQFLFMLLGGTFLIAGSILPLTVQEPAASEQGLDVACMATPWLFICGFSAAFSAIFSKAVRIKQVVGEAVALRRASINARDVILPSVLILATNVALLIAWTVVSPMVWTRIVVDNYDQYGRAVETYSTCRGQVEDGETNLSIVFFSLLAAINVMLVIYAFYQVYSTRRFPTQFNESLHVTLCIAILLEAFLLGGPILFLVQTDPMVDFLVKVLLLTSFCIGILGPNFVPKLYAQRRSSLVSPSGNNSLMREWGSYLAHGRVIDMEWGSSTSQFRHEESWSQASNRRGSRRLSLTRGGGFGETDSLQIIEDESTCMSSGIFMQKHQGQRQSREFQRQPFPPLRYASSVAQLRANIHHRNSYTKQPPETIAECTLSRFDE